MHVLSQTQCQFIWNVLIEVQNCFMKNPRLDDSGLRISGSSQIFQENFLQFRRTMDKPPELPTQRSRCCFKDCTYSSNTLRPVPARIILPLRYQPNKICLPYQAKCNSSSGISDAHNASHLFSSFRLLCCVWEMKLHVLPVTKFD